MAKRKYPGIDRMKDGLYRVRVTYLDPTTGKRREVDRQIEATSVTMAVRVREELREELKAQAALVPAPQPQPRTVRDYVTSWLQQRTSRLSYSTRLRYAEHLDIAMERIGDIPCEQLKRADVQGLLGGLEAEGYGAHSINGMLRVLKTATKDMQVELELRLWACDRVTGPRVPKYTRAQPNVLTANEVPLVLAQLEPPWLPLAQVMVWTGVRFCEAAALRWEDFDEVTGEIRIERSAYRGQVADRTKTDEPRVVAAPPALKAVLRDHRGWMLATQHPGLSSGLVFPSMAGKPMHSGQLSKPLHSAAEKAGVAKRITPHGLRRTFNNLLRQAGVEHVTIRSMTGHTTDAMTHHYSHVELFEKQHAQGRVIALTQPNSTPSGGESGDGVEGSALSQKKGCVFGADAEI